MKKSRAIHPILVMFIMSLALLGVASAQESAKKEGDSKAVPSPAVSSDYRIGAADVLAINVWKEQEISRVVPVRPDGKISLPLIGDIVASGLTPVQLQAAIREQLHKYLENPEVTVIVQEARSRQFNVMGQVNKPGTYSLAQPLTVLDAIALAGGFRDFAKTGKVYVLRVAADGSHQRLPFNYKHVVKGEDLSQNVALQAGDTIVVP